MRRLFHRHSPAALVRVIAHLLEMKVPRKREAPSKSEQEPAAISVGFQRAEHIKKNNVIE